MKKKYLLGMLICLWTIFSVAIELPWEQHHAPQPDPAARPSESAEIAELRRKAEAGDPAAQNSLGVRYAQGNDISHDDRLSAFWFHRAAEQGNALAQTNLGSMYEDGRGVPQDDRQAVYWYRRAADQGHARAQFNLGAMYTNGRGVPQDDRQAVLWYRRAADQGYVSAQFNLGWMYEKGHGVVQDDRQAVYWFRRAAEQGHVAAQYAVGFMHEEGRGVERNVQQALDWYRKAAEGGFPEAAKDLERLTASLALQPASTIPMETDDADPLPLPARAYLDFRGWGEMAEKDSISGVKDITSMIMIRQGPIVFHGNRFQGGAVDEWGEWKITGNLSRNPSASSSRDAALISFAFKAEGTCADGHTSRRTISVRGIPVRLYTHAPESVGINSLYAEIDQYIYQIDPDALLNQISYESYRREKGGYNEAKRTHEPDKITSVTLKRIMCGRSEGEGHPFLNWSLDLRHAPSIGWPDSAIRAWRQEQEQNR